MYICLKIFEEFKTSHLYSYKKNKKNKKNNELKIKLYWEKLKKNHIEEYYKPSKLTNCSNDFNDKIKIIYEILYIPNELKRKKKLLDYIKILFSPDINIIYKYKYYLQI